MVGVTAAEEEAPVLVKSASGDPLTKEEAEVLEKEGSGEDNEHGKCRYGAEREARTSIPPEVIDGAVDLATAPSPVGPQAPRAVATVRSRALLPRKSNARRSRLFFFCCCHDR